MSSGNRGPRGPRCCRRVDLAILRCGAEGGRVRNNLQAGEHVAAERVGAIPLVAHAAELASIDDAKGFARDVRSALPSGVIAIVLVADANDPFALLFVHVTTRPASDTALRAAPWPTPCGPSGTTKYCLPTIERRRAGQR